MTGFKPVDAEQLVRAEATPMNYAEDCFLPLEIVDKRTRKCLLRFSLRVFDEIVQRPSSEALCTMSCTSI